MYGRQSTTNFVRSQKNDSSNNVPPIAVLDHTSSVQLCCPWENIQRYHAHYSTLQVDVYRKNMTERHLQSSCSKKMFKLLSKEYGNTKNITLHQIFEGIANNSKIQSLLKQSQLNWNVWFDGLIAFDRMRVVSTRSSFSLSSSDASFNVATSNNVVGLSRSIGLVEFEEIGLISARCYALFEAAHLARGSAVRSQLSNSSKNKNNNNKSNNNKNNNNSSNTKNIKSFFDEFAIEYDDDEFEDEHMEEETILNYFTEKEEQLQSPEIVNYMHIETKKLQQHVQEMKVRLYKTGTKLSEIPMQIDTSELVTVLSEGVTDIFAPTNFEASHKSRQKLIEMLKNNLNKVEISWKDWLNSGMLLLYKHQQTSASSTENQGFSGSTPVGTAYIHLEELATSKSIDGTYDMICFDKNNLSIVEYPPYLSASIYLVSFIPFYSTFVICTGALA